MFFISTVFSCVLSKKLIGQLNQRQRGFYTNTKSSALMSKTVENASIGTPQEPEQKQEVLAPRHRVRSDCVCWRCVWECINCHFIWWRGNAQSGRRKKQMREENNLDSDYQPSLMQEEENISIATKTTSQCHVTMVEAASVQKTDSCTRTLSSLHLPVVPCWGRANSWLWSLCRSNSCIHTQSQN